MKKEASTRKAESFFMVYGWMAKLKLSASELLVYGLIHSFSSSSPEGFKGSANYIATTLGLTSRTILTVLRKLTDKQLIQKKKAGRYCNYSITPMKDFHTSPMKDLHTIYEESSQVSMKDFHIIHEDLSYHSKDISKVDIKSSSSETTTTFLINLCKTQGYPIENKKAQEAINAGICHDWLVGAFTYPERIAEKIKEEYSDRSPEEKRKLFISLLPKLDIIDNFSEWRKNKEAETETKEKYKQQEAAENERQQRIKEVRITQTTCPNCKSKFIPETERGSCSCGWDYYFCEELEKYEFQEAISLTDAFKEITKAKTEKQIDFDDLPEPLKDRYRAEFKKFTNEGMLFDTAEYKAWNIVLTEYKESA